MLIKNRGEIPYSEVTPKSLYLNRRRFLRGAAAGVAALAGRFSQEILSPSIRAQAGNKLSGVVKGPFGTDEKVTPFDDVTHYNNFYEFGTDKEQPAELAKNFRTHPWSVSVEGEVKKPKVYDMDAIAKMAPLEERIYRHRCVEAWSIVVPWIGFPLNMLLKQVEPTPKARFVAFQSLYDPKQMPMARWAGISFPYVEGLRLDEAMHPLALLCVGMYGETLPNQNGAPVRLVVPWKYGFKSIKSIVKIRLVESQPPTTWNLAIPREYGFYSNVNPDVDHPRWSQARERRLGEFLKRKTLAFNGYGDQVAQMYSGMDLMKNF
ncbi:MAG: protein-methionine-sulfoxide reductase catalytic subunit MsrP [Acidobacteria bacterium]|nr:protein-methionine-sulfoxide reductase catalytic subunit MsrP [Acidobacteriota bacterium]